jgi:hypothetical protein
MKHSYRFLIALFYFLISHFVHAQTLVGNCLTISFFHREI